MPEAAATFGLPLVALVVWAIRQEGRINLLYTSRTEDRKLIDALSTKHDNLDSKVLNQLSEVREALARIEGRLGVPKNGHS